MQLLFQTPTNQNFYLCVYRVSSAGGENPAEVLTPDQCLRYKNINEPSLKKIYLQSRIVLNQHLEFWTSKARKDFSFQTLAEGKPYLSGEKMDFNISHSADCFALAFSKTHRVGVDIQEIRAPQHMTGVMKKVFSEAEQEAVLAENSAADKLTIFNKIWSGKEAIIKTVGGGVFKDARSISIDTKLEKPTRLPEHYGPLSSWNLCYYNEIPGFILSLGTKSGTFNQTKGDVYSFSGE